MNPIARRRLITGAAALAAYSTLRGGVKADDALPPPPPRVVAGIRLVTLGDSIVEYNHLGESNGKLHSEARGEVQWAKFFEPRIVYNVVYSGADSRYYTGANHGKAGATTADVIALQMEPAIAKRPDVAFLAIGTNDITNGFNGSIPAATTYATIVANMTTILNRFYAAGIPVVLSTIRPRSNVPMYAGGSDARYVIERVNNWIRGVARLRRGVKICDLAMVYADPASATGDPRVNYLDPTDLTHPTHFGAFMAGKAIAAIIAGLFPGQEPIDYLGPRDDLYDVAKNPFGNIVSNGYLTGTSGAVSGAGVSGTVAQGWALSRTTGSLITVAGSKVASGNNPDAQRLTFSLPGGGAGIEVFNLRPSADINLGANNFQPGTYYQCGFKVNVQATSALIGLPVQTFNNNGVVNYGMRNYNNIFGMPNAAYSGWFLSEPLLVPASPTSWRASLTPILDATQAGTAIVTIEGAFLRQVQDPSLGWT